jgi:hypothetical protein
MRKQHLGQVSHGNTSCLLELLFQASQAVTLDKLGIAFVFLMLRACTIR